MNFKKSFLVLIVTVSIFATNYNLSYAEDNDLDEQIRNQQVILNQLSQKKEQKDKELIKRLDSLESKVNNYDASGAVDSLATQILELKQQFKSTESIQEKILNRIESMEKNIENFKKTTVQDSDEITSSGIATTRFLVNPGQGSNVSYTQDAINSQGNSTMVFRYADNQVYKIYCRRGYLTDLAFKKGEEIKYVGGGDTSGWAVSNTAVDGVPHLYIKPIVETSSTNLIVTTNKHSYQLILNTSDWYNPMVYWVYDAENREANLIAQKKEERITTGKINAMNVEDLDFAYEVSGDGNDKISMVFSDGDQTYLKFKKVPKKQLPVFIRQKGHKEMSLVNYTIKDNYFIIEKVFDIAQIKDGNDTLTVKRKS